MVDKQKEVLQVERKGDTATLWMNRPEVSNALNRKLQREIIDTLAKINEDDLISTVILRGRGNVFSSGQDGTETKGMNANEARQWIREIEELYDSIRNLSKVTIAAVDGMAAAASLQLAMLCDLRILTDTTELQMQELRMGIPCISGASLLLPMIGETRTRKFIFEAKPISAETALSWGLVSTVVSEDDFDNTITKTCEDIGKLGPLSVKVTKEWLKELSEDNFRKTLKKTADLHSEIFGAGEAYNI